MKDDDAATISLSFKLFSFFSGSGLLDLGFESNGFKVEFVDEFNNSFLEAYKYSRRKMHIAEPAYGYHRADINDFLNLRKDELLDYMIDAWSDGSIVGFIGGPPCPDFSVAGKNRGREGDNGRLSKSYVDLICSAKPDFFLFENVKGLWRTARHREYYEDLKEQLRESGFVLTDRLVNSLEYGVPQDRDRIMLFGVRSDFLHNRGKNDSCIFSFPWLAYCKYNLDDLKKLPWPKTSAYSENSVTDCPSGIPRELTVQSWFEKNDVSNHPNGNDAFKPRAGIVRMTTVSEGDDSKKCYKRLHRWRYSPTAAYGNNEVHLHPYKSRRISVAEALAIQSLPKEFELPPDMSLTDKFKTVGNGVPFLLSSGISRTIRLFMESIYA